MPISLCPPGSKKPLGHGWSKTRAGTRWQKKDWTADEIDNAFMLRGDLNVGVRLGPDSKLIDFECDSPEAARDLADLFEDDVPVAPTWSSRRGAHRLFAWHDDLEKIGKSSIRIGGLDILVGGNGKGVQSLLPPSVTDGYTRQWKIPLDECDPPQLPECALQQLLCEFSHSKRNTGIQIEAGTGGCRAYTVTQDHLSDCVPVLLCKPVFTLKDAIRRTVPSGAGFRRKQIFAFARHLKAMPEYADSDAMAMLPVVTQWHMAALPYIGTKDFDITFADFGSAWNDVKFSIGKGPLMRFCEMALTRPLPKCAEKYQAVDSLCRMVLLCRELQRHHGNSPFFLACRDAGDVLGVSHMVANKWLNFLVDEDVLELVKSGFGTRSKASEYLFVGED